MNNFNRYQISRRGVLNLGAAGAASLAMPHIVRAQESTIKVGVPTILSGRVAILGETSLAGINLAVDTLNEQGGINGRMIEVIGRDSKGKPDEAARIVRDMINNDGCQIILNAEASGATFAVHEVMRDVGLYCVHSISETSKLTAEPANRVDWIFRSARQGIHDAVAGGLYASKLADAGAKRWATCSPDYSYGRDTTAQFRYYLEKFAPDVEFIAETWPKIFQPDYTENIVALVNAQADAVYSALWGGDLVAFFDQASLYGLFENMQGVCVNMGDTPVVEAIKALPSGIHSGSRYHKEVPDTPANEKWDADYRSKSGLSPTNWAWQSYTAAQFIIEALKETGGDTNRDKLAAATRGRTIESPFGVDGTLAMREADNTLVGYALGYGKTISEPPYISDFEPVAWDQVLEEETDWKKESGFL